MAKKESAVRKGSRRKRSLLKSVAGRRIKPKLPEEKPEEPALEKYEDRRFPIVGLGASAGGLEAFEEFFSKMSSDSGMAFILVSHLDPSHSSILPDLLKRFTTMPVLQAEDGVRVEPNHLYIIPPNRDMAIFHRTLQLTAPVKTFRGIRMPIDFFLRSLADDQEEMAICVILSGTGTDGSMGVRAIHAAGGMTMVQEAATAKYDGMPRSAIDTKLADYVLPASKMPEQLIAYVKKFPLKRPKAVPLATLPNAIQKILAVLRSKSGHDFTFYKKSTLFRRIERRMAVHNIEDPSVYVRYLQERKEEAHLLFKELLITVTNFFRDPEAFDVLKAKVWLRLLEGKPEDYTLRVWVPGCSTGEEAYSIAMTLQEYLSEAKLGFKVQIFGTDIDEDAINEARTGVYYDNIGIDVSPERLRRFFSKEDRGYRVKKEVREMIVFAVQNVIKDAPFTKLDLISCRNFLIYVEPEMQNKLLPLFHYSLKPGGILFLGSSESTGRFTDLFTAIDKKWKFFAAKSVSPAQAIAAFPWTYEYEPKEAAGEEKKAKKQGITELTQTFLLNTFAPPSVVVDDQGEILYVHGQTGKYLEPAPGQASLRIVSMVKEGIRFELRSGLHDAMTKKRESRYEGLKVKTNGGEREINLIIRPLTKTNGRQGLVLVTFEELPSRIPKKPKARERRLPVKDRKRALDLEQELHSTKETLQTTVEEMQATNEELQSANEELQSANEELQSTNEELETSKEELQSVNEELLTVNAELQAKIEQLSTAEGKLKALLDSIHTGVLFLDRNLGIKRFTPEAVDLFTLIPTDVGRPISDIRSNLKYGDLLADARKVLETLQNSEREVESVDGQWYWMRIMPTRSSENVIDGLVFTFTDISQAKQALEKVELQSFARKYAESIVNTVREPLLVLDENLKVISANDSFHKVFRLKDQVMKGRFIYDLGNQEWNIPALRTLLDEVLTRDRNFEDFQMEHDFPLIGKKKMLLNARKVIHEDAGVRMILLAIEDVTERR